MEIFLTALAVLGIIIAAVVLIAVITVFFCYCRLCFSYNEEKGVYLAIEIFKIRIPLLPKKEKKKEAKKKPEKEKKQGKMTELIPKDNGEKVKLLFELLKCLSLKFRLFKFKFFMLYGTGDAARTATDIGRIYAAFGAFFGAAQNIVYVDKPTVVITPEYLEKTVKLDVEAALGLKIFSAVKTLYRCYKAAVKFSKKESEVK